jgi:ribosomal peptide maturation radical SAM protein 1
MAQSQQDICLVCMPYSPVALPAIGIGLLHTLLEKAGFSVKTLYPNLWFTERVGIDRFNIAIGTRTEDLAVEWLFSGAAFRDQAILGNTFLDRLIARNWPLRKRARAQVLETFHALRAEAEAFIDEAAERILEQRPRIVGCTSTFQQHVASLAVLRRIRELDAGVVTLMGGANCETRMGRTTHHAFPWIDYIVSGEADELIVPLIRSIVESGRDVPAADLPFGVLAPVHRTAGYPTVREGDGVPRATSQVVGSLPVPDYDDYFVELEAASFRDRVVPALSFESSRGCWWGERSHCTFCGLNGTSMKYRSKDPATVLGEIEELHRRYGIANFHAVDNIIDLAYLETMLPTLAKRNPPLRLFYETKANLKKSQVEVLRAAGVRWMQPGIESMNSNVLKLMGKGVAAWQNVQLLKYARQVGVRLLWMSILGFPGEKDEWYGETAEWMPLIAHLQPGGIGQLRFDRYSPYHSKAQHYGLDLVPSELYREVYPLPEAELADLAYFFERRDQGDEGRNLVDQPIPGKPGLEAYRLATAAWRDAWAGAVFPVLRYQERGTVLEIRDTRPIAPEAETTVEGVGRQVLLATEEALTREEIVRRLDDIGGARAGVILDAIDGLIARRLMVEIDRKIVNLVLADPIPPMPDLLQIPIGIVLPKAESRPRVEAVS